MDAPDMALRVVVGPRPGGALLWIEASCDMPAIGAGGDRQFPADRIAFQLRTMVVDKSDRPFP